jgi:hypothetical protein
MFDRFYQMSMAHGSRILFAVAALLVAFGIVGTVYQFGRLGTGNEIRADWMLMMNTLFAAVTNGIFPFVGAVAIHRFDKSRNGTAFTLGGKATNPE